MHIHLISAKQAYLNVTTAPVVSEYIMEKYRATELSIVRQQLEVAIEKLAEARTRDEILSVLKPLYQDIRELKHALETLLKQEEININSNN